MTKERAIQRFREIMISRIELCAYRCEPESVRLLRRCARHPWGMWLAFWIGYALVMVAR